MATLIGVINADGGGIRGIGLALRRAMGSHPCWLSSLAHSPTSPRASWRELEESITAEFGHSFELVYQNHRTPAQLEASKGREPCVLIDDGGGHLSMVVDWNDLELAAGDVTKFEQILRSKLMMY